MPTINEAYEWMQQLIQRLSQSGAWWNRSFWVANSYCPGDYGLSIQNRKIAGIAQRRRRCSVRFDFT